MSSHLDRIRYCRNALAVADEDYQESVQAAEDARVAGESITKADIALAAGISRPTLDAMLKRRGKAA